MGVAWEESGGKFMYECGKNDEKFICWHTMPDKDMSWVKNFSLRGLS